MRDEGFEFSEFFETPEISHSAEKIPRKVVGSSSVSDEKNSGVSMESTPSSFSEEAEGFYVIDYDSGPFEGVGKFVLKPQKVTPSPAVEKDERRDLFDRMRDIARGEERVWMREDSRFYITRERREDARIFYKQAVFMKDFVDDFAETVPFKTYFPCYQKMGYKQLRTYFTWRSRVRGGYVGEASLSYAFLYIYELLNNVGVASPQEGLERLVAFWRDFREYEMVTLNAYMVRWLKDYFIYYGLEGEFGDFVETHGIEKHYPEARGEKDAQDGERSFDWFCSLSKYDARKSPFFTDGDKGELMREGFGFAMRRLEEAFGRVGIWFDEAVFGSVRGARVWEPFADALFFPWLEQADRRVALSECELYVCKGNRWSYSTVIASTAGRRFVGFVMKRVESVLRQLAGFGRKLETNVNTVDKELLARLLAAGVSLEKIVEDAVVEFYREATKTVVSVDVSSLRRIREEALSTQAALSVEEEMSVSSYERVNALAATGCALKSGDSDEASSVTTAPSSLCPWTAFKAVLSDIELQALAVILYDDGVGVKRFADSMGVMLEVLVDGINGKAMDCVGDSLLDEGLAIFEDYVEQVKGLLP